MSGRMIGGVCVSYSYKIKRANPYFTWPTQWVQNDFSVS